jgi:hypothetical protein
VAIVVVCIGWSDCRRRLCSRVVDQSDLVVCCVAVVVEGIRRRLVEQIERGQRGLWVAPAKKNMVVGNGQMWARARYKKDGNCYRRSREKQQNKFGGAVVADRSARKADADAGAGASCKWMTASIQRPSLDWAPK